MGLKLSSLNILSKGLMYSNFIYSVSYSTEFPVSLSNMGSKSDPPLTIPTKASSANSGILPTYIKSIILGSVIICLIILEGIELFLIIFLVSFPWLASLPISKRIEAYTSTGNPSMKIFSKEAITP